jgi:hypothetical protein
MAQEKSHAKSIASVVIIRLKPYGDFKRQNRFLISTAGGQRTPEIVPRIEELRIQLDRFPMRGDRLIPPALRGEGYPQIIVISGIRRIHRNRSANEINRFFSLSRHYRDDSQEMQRIRLIRMLGKDRPIYPRRFGQTAGMLMLYGGPKRLRDGLGRLSHRIETKWPSPRL